MSKYKGGKLPFVDKKTDLHYYNYRGMAPVALPPCPAEFGHETLVPTWGMLANDQVGDCVIAGIVHQIMLWNAERGNAVDFSDAAVLAVYSAITGYDPNAALDESGNNPTDQGTSVRDALKYFQQVGIADTDGVTHKIGPYMRLNPKNLDHVKEALYLFGSITTGFEMIDATEDQFDAHQPWHDVPGAKPEGGHCAPLAAFRAGMPVAITWGALQPMLKSFFMVYCDEAWVVLDPEMLLNNKSPEGFDLAALQADMKAVMA